MIQERLLFFDQRNAGWCVLCGEPLDPAVASREHVPSKALLDKPYPSDLSIVLACPNCNHSLSMDEEYFAA